MCEVCERDGMQHDNCGLCEPTIFNLNRNSKKHGTFDSYGQPVAIGDNVLSINDNQKERIGELIAIDFNSNKPFKVQFKGNNWGNYAIIIKVELERKE